MESSRQIERELKMLENDKKSGSAALKSEQYRMSRLLLGEMGKDMDEVLSGRKKVRVTWMEKFRYKTKRFLNMIRRVI